MATDKPRREREPATAAEDAAELDSLTREFRRHAGKISRQAAVVFAGTVFTVVAGYFFKIYVARVIGAEGLGIYALGLNTLSLFAVFASLGLPTTIARFVARYRGIGQRERVRPLFFRALRVLILSSCALGGLMVLSSRWISEVVYGEPDLARYLPFFALLLPVGVVIGLCSGYLRGSKEVARQVAITSFLRFPAKIGLTVALFAFGWALPAYVAAEVSSQLFAAAILAFAVARRLPAAAAAAPRRGLDREVKIFAATMMGMNGLSFLTTKVDQVLLGILLPVEQVGVYSIAMTSALFVPILLSSLNSIFGPIIAELHARGETALLQRLFQTTTKWCLGVTWPLVAVVLLFSQALMGLFGAEFEAGATCLSVLALGQMVNVSAGSAGYLLLMCGYQRAKIKAIIAMAILTVVLNLLLIPRWGILGAAAAGAIGLVITNLVWLWMVRYYLRITPYNRGYLRLAVPIAASALAVFAVSWWSRAAGGDRLLWLLLALFSAYAAFLSTAGVLSLDRDDRIIARAVWARARAVARSLLGSGNDG